VKKVIICFVSMLALVGCQQGAGIEKVAPRSGIDREYMDASVKPGDDFFHYVNGKWIAEAEIPADKSSYGGFVLLQDEAQEDVKAIIEMSAEGEFEKGSDEQKVGDFYKSYLDMDKRDERGVEPLAPELARIAAIGDYDDLAVYFAGATKRGYGMPFGLAQFPDMKNPNAYGVYVFQGGLGLPDREYYFGDESKEIRDAYVTHIEKMFELAGLPDAAASAKTIMAFETRLAEQHMLKEDTRNWAANYNKVAVADLSNVMPQFNWQAYLDELGANELDGMIFLMTDYTKALDGIIRDTDFDSWKTYLSWTAVNGAASNLTDELDEQNFDFYGRTLSGTEEQQELWRRAVSSVNASLGEVVGKVYVKHHFPPEAKERMMTLVGNLIAAYEKSIGELDWMGEETKIEALDKLGKFTPKIGYPDKWRDYAALDIDPDDLFGNLERSTLAEYKRQLDRQGGPVDRDEWGMNPQTGNAYYNPALN